MVAKYKVALLGNRKLSILAAEYFHSDPEADLFVVLNPDDTGVDEGGALSLKKHARSWGIDTYQPEGLKTEAQIEPLQAFDPDIILSCSYAKIIPVAAIDLARIASINVHYSDLPRNRGCLPVVWTIAQREADLSVSLHKLASGIDDGDIIIQKRRPLRPGITAQAAGEICASLGFDAVKEYWLTVKAGTPLPGQPQDSAHATYHKLRHPYDRHPPWNGNAEDVAAMVNSLTFPPHPPARARFLDECALAGEWKIIGPTLVMEEVSKDRPVGSLKRKDGVLTVACAGGRLISVYSIEPNDEDCDMAALRSRLDQGDTLIFQHIERPLYAP